MQRKKFNFTQKALENLKPPVDGSGYNAYYDTGQRNLMLLITDKGNKSFYFSKTVKGRQVRFKVGSFPSMKLGRARDVVAGHLREIDKGSITVEDLKGPKAAEMTFGNLFDLYMEKHAKLHKKAWWFDEDQYQRHIGPAFKNRKLSSITRVDIQNFHTRLGKNHGETGANRILDIISSVYNRAIEWGIWKEENPTRFVRKFKQKARDRFLQRDEIPRFFKALNEELNDSLRDYIYLSLFTGARKSNVLAMRWDEINFQRKEWRIPETKNGEPLTLPLVDIAMDILNNRKSVSEGSEFVFPSNSASGHLVDPKKAWKRLLERAEIEDLRIHDLRRTLGSWQTIAGASPFIVGKSLGHKDMKSTQVYARMDIDPIRDSMNNAINLMLENQGDE